MKTAVLITAIVLDVVILGTFLWFKMHSDTLIIWASVIGLIMIFASERWYIRPNREASEAT